MFIFPHAGPDIKYLLGFVRTQLSTTTTIVLVFGPKVSRVWKGQGDQWDSKSRVRSITASFSLNGVGLVPEESPDLYQENEELKVGILMIVIFSWVVFCCQLLLMVLRNCCVNGGESESKAD